MYDMAHGATSILSYSGSPLKVEHHELFHILTTVPAEKNILLPF